MHGEGASFEGYGYRTSSRFASWTTIVVDDDGVTVSGPRVGVLPYRLWIAAQVLLLALIVPSLLVMLLLRDWRYLLLPMALLVAHLFVGVAGAAGLWELANMMAMDSGHPAHSFPLDSVSGVKIGPGWARNGLWLVILPYVAQINRASEGHTVSFEASAGDTSGDVVYAFHMRTEEQARELARLLGGE